MVWLASEKLELLVVDIMIQLVSVCGDRMRRLNVFVHLTLPLARDFWKLGD